MALAILPMTIHTPQCFHPMGEGIHVLLPTDQFLVDIIELMDVQAEVGKIYRQLVQTTKPGQTGRVVALLQGQSPAGMAKVYLVIRLAKAFDRPVEAPDAVALLAEEGYQELAKQAARYFMEEFKAL